MLVAIIWSPVNVKDGGCCDASRVTPNFVDKTHKNDLISTRSPSSLDCLAILAIQVVSTSSAEDQPWLRIRRPRYHRIFPSVPPLAPCPLPLHLERIHKSIEFIAFLRFLIAAANKYYCRDLSCKINETKIVNTKLQRV